MALKSLEDALVHEMQDLLNAEKQLVKALPKMAKKASDPQLKDCFETHLQQTQAQVQRLENALETLQGKVRAKKCEAMSGLIEESEVMIKESQESDVLDTMLIAAAQKVEHYEIGSYGTACAWADMLGRNDIKDLLHQTLEEEKEADRLLTEIAMNVNQKAMHAA